MENAFISSANDLISSLLGEWSSDINALSIIFRIFLSFVFSAIIGCERANKRHSAGLRTFILVSMTSTISMILDLFIIQNTAVKIPVLSAATIIGTAMISGNSILFTSRNQIKGLTTSAALWMCSIIGLTCGAGLYTASLISFIVLLVILSSMLSLEFFLKNRSNHFEIHLELKNRDSLQDFVNTIRKLGLKIDDIESNAAYIGSGLSVYTVTLTIKSEELKKYKSHSEIVEALSSLEYINHIEEIN